MKLSRRAFTIIELLVVVSIISILTALAAVSYSTVQQRGRDAQRKNDLNQIKIALSTYYGAQVPAAFVTATSKTTINGSSDTLSAALEPNYMKNVPVDPINAGSNVYKYQSLNSAADFKLFGTLENKNDTKGWGTGSSWVTDGLIIQNE